MLIKFEVAGVPVEFYRNWFLGNVELRTPEGKISLQSLASISTHFSLSLSKKWTVSMAGTEVTIEKIRPLLLAGFRPNRYLVIVGGAQVADVSGY